MMRNQQKSRNRNYLDSSNKNKSTLGTIGCVVSELVIMCILFSGTDIDNVPAILMAIIWDSCAINN